jgi:type I restriction enzyme S subunit
MAGEWQVSTLENAPLEIIDGDRGTNYPNQAEFSATGYCLFLNAGNVTTNGFRFSDCVFITAGKDASLRKGKLNRKDVILTTRGTVGNTAFFDGSVPFDHIRINSGMVILRAQTPALEPLYLYLFVRSALFHAQVSALRTGSAQPQLPIRDINRIEIPLPPPEEQRAIANILGTLDDKIELNRRMNETLEAMARALFKSWFVDFDPVRAKAEGRDPGLPKPVADLFPARLIASELGDIPEGWKFQSFASTVEIISGGTPKTSVPAYWDGDIPWFSIVDAPTGTDVWVVDTEKKITQAGVENSSTRILPVGTTIISARGTIGRVALVGVPMAMNQSCYGIKGKVGAHGLFTYFSMQELVADLQQYAHGSVFDTITRDTLAGISVVVPPKTVVETFEKIASPILERVRQTILNTRIIATIRNALLPKLISGELRIGGTGDVVNGETG